MYLKSLPPDKTGRAATPTLLRRAQDLKGKPKNQQLFQIRFYPFPETINFESLRKLNMQWTKVLHWSFLKFVTGIEEEKVNEQRRQTIFKRIDRQKGIFSRREKAWVLPDMFHSASHLRVSSLNHFTWHKSLEFMSVFEKRVLMFRILNVF